MGHAVPERCLVLPICQVFENVAFPLRWCTPTLSGRHGFRDIVLLKLQAVGLAVWRPIALWPMSFRRRHENAALPGPRKLAAGSWLNMYERALCAPGPHFPGGAVRT